MDENAVPMRERLTRENLHGIVGKALSAASPFLMPHNRTRRPYLPIPDTTVQQFRRILETQFPDLLWRG